MEYASYEEFKKMDMRVGTIRSVEPVEGADKLLRFLIDFGETKAFAQPAEGAESPDDMSGFSEPAPKLRQIVSGIREFFPEYEKLVGKQALYIINLEPRTIRGAESNGMLMAVDGKDGKPVFLSPEVEVAPGAKVR